MKLSRYFFICKKSSRHISRRQSKIIPPFFHTQKIIPFQEIVPPSPSSLLSPSAYQLPSLMTHGSDHASLAWTKLTFKLCEATAWGSVPRRHHHCSYFEASDCARELVGRSACKDQADLHAQLTSVEDTSPCRG